MRYMLISVPEENARTFREMVEKSHLDAQVVMGQPVDVTTPGPWERPTDSMSKPRAVNLKHNPQHRLEGPCPWCTKPIRVSVDVFYNRFTGTCPSCGNRVAYRAPNGTFRSDVMDPATGIWRIDRDHYCANCRHFVNDCTCQLSAVMPEGVATSTPPPWAHSSVGRAPGS